MRKLLKKIFAKKRPRQTEPAVDTITHYRRLGVKIGNNVSLIAPVSPVIFSSEPYLVSIGDNASSGTSPTATPRRSSTVPSA